MWPAGWWTPTTTGRAFFARRIHFPGADDDRQIKKLIDAIGKNADDVERQALTAMRSAPFDPPERGRIAVKIVTATGMENDCGAFCVRTLIVTSDPTASDALSKSLFGSEPTLLEQVVFQAANDLKVTGFGQRTRAALRRNRSAESNSVLPYSMFKDVGALIWSGISMPSLFYSTQSSLFRHHHLAERMRSCLSPCVTNLQWYGIWSRNCGLIRLTTTPRLFIDYDNVPIPFCPMYPDARDLIRSNPAALPQPLAKIVQRIRNQVQETPIMRESLDCLSDLTSTDLQNLEDTRKNFTSQAVYQRGETLLEWEVRVHQTRRCCSDGRAGKLVLLSNTLIHSVISSVVSLAVWDHELASSEVQSTMPWGRHAVGGEPPDGDATDEDPDDRVHTVLIYLMASVCAWYLTLNSCCCRWKRLSDYMIKEGSAV